jgi:phosphoglycolate phosphatase
MTSGARVRAALIDLDGTLLDTIPDLAAAANRMLCELGAAALPLEAVKGFVGRGIENLVSRCLEASALPASVSEERALAIFSRCYEEESGLRTVLFPRVTQGLESLAAQGLRLACVTNKARRFTGPLLERTRLAGHFAVVVSGDDAEHLKPHPAPYLEACRRLGVRPAEALVIGDSRNDVIAAREAGCPVVCVPYGYNEGEAASQLQCDALVDDLAQAAGYVHAMNGTTEEA